MNSTRPVAGEPIPVGEYIVDELEERGDALATDKLMRGHVWCRECGRRQVVDGARCLREGWPKCCTYTMTIDPPERPEE